MGLPELEAIMEELGHDGSFGLKDRYEGDPMTFDQARRMEAAKEEFYDGRPFTLGSTDFYDPHPHDTFLDTMDQVRQDWPGVEVRFGGDMDHGTECAYIDRAYMLYGDVDDQATFERYMRKHFQPTLSIDPAENNGIDPLADEGIRGKQSGDRFNRQRYYDDRTDDTYLWAMPNEFHFQEDEGWGPYCRLWWDD